VKPKNLHCPADECDKKFAYLGWFKTHIRKCEHISPENKKDIKSWIEHEEKQEAFLQEARKSTRTPPRTLTASAPSALGGLAANGMPIPQENASTTAHTSVPGITYSTASPPLAISLPAQASPRSINSSFGNATSPYGNLNMIYNASQMPAMTSHPSQGNSAGSSTAPDTSGQFDLNGGIADVHDWFDAGMNSDRFQPADAPPRQLRSQYGQYGRHGTLHSL
jgi:hypothetical protein